MDRKRQLPENTYNRFAEFAMAIIHLSPREMTTTYALSSNGTSTNIILGTLTLVLLLVVSLSTALVIRHRRRTRQVQAARLSLIEKRDSLRLNKNNRLTVTVNPVSSPESKQSFVEKRLSVFSPSSSPSHSPVPEIRITFPEEYDDMGKRQSGRVLLVRVGDHTIGMEPMREGLPSYEETSSDRFDSLDFERKSDLKEKDILV